MPIKRIIVPLDGSALAEGALPLVTRLAQPMGASVTLLHVLEERPPALVHGEPHLGDVAGAQSYLQRVADRIRGECPGGVDVHAHANAVRDVARSIAEHAGEFASDLIVMTAHGRGGVGRWVYGSIAQQIVTMNACPVLLLNRERSTTPPDAGVRRVLVPLDADPTHEVAIPLACGLAAALDAELTLLTVVPTITEVGGARSGVCSVMPRALAAELDIEAQSAADYLARVPLNSAGERSISESRVTRQVRRGDPAAEILQAAEELGPALIVMGTHRRVGVSAFWNASVGSRVASETRCPLVMIPLPAEA